MANEEERHGHMISTTSLHGESISLKQFKLERRLTTTKGCVNKISNVLEK